MKQQLYVWVNKESKSWTTSNNETAVLLSMVEDGDATEYHFKTIDKRLKFEKELDEDGYLYNSYETFIM